MKINLHDVNFAGNPSSVWRKSPLHVEWVRGRKEWDGLTIFTDGYVPGLFASTVRSTHRIGWLHEPRCLHLDYYKHIAMGQYKFVLTYYEPLLQRKGFLPCVYGGVWLDRKDWGLRPKTKMVSMLYGAKKSTAGHRLRHKISDSLEEWWGIDYYGYRGTPVDYGPAAKLKVLGDYRFSIVTETCRENNLFTEWLLDCFAAGTVPIFWGCPNIGDYFNPAGILQFRTLAELKEILAGLSLREYTNRLPAIADNLARVGEYEITEDWIFKHVLKGQFDVEAKKL